MTRNHKADGDSCQSGDDDASTSSLSPSPAPSSASSIASSSSSMSPVNVPTKSTSHTLSFGISRILDDSPRKPQPPFPKVAFPFPHREQAFPNPGILTSSAAFLGATGMCFPAEGHRVQAASPGVIKVPAHHPGNVVHFPPFPASTMFPWMADRKDGLTGESTSRHLYFPVY